MRYRITESVAGEAHSFHQGQIVEGDPSSNRILKDLVRGGIAVPIADDDAPVETATAPSGETATARPQRTARKRRKSQPG